jgi:dTDP-4-amino-4,6-dideoxygalactose transaminase
MANNKILLCLAHMSGQEMKYIQEAFDTNWVVPLGPNVNAFEQDLEQLCGQDKRVVVLCSGTAAIHLALVNLGVGRDDEVICQSMTFSASANPVVYQGATPVFVDSERGTWNMDPNLLEEAIKDRIAKTGRKPKAIIPVYLYGMPALIDDIMEIAQRYDIPVIEDSAEAFGSRYRGQLCGTFGKFGIMSFNGNKMITTSGGGALICPDDATKKKTMFYATQSREPVPYYLHKEIGYNYRMSNICAGIGRGQMTVLDEHLAHHKHLCDRYVELLEPIDGITVHTNLDERSDSNYWLNTILIDPAKTGTDYDTIRLHLEACNIESRPLWKPMHTQPVFSGAPAYVNGVSEELFSMGLCLPSGPWVSDEDVEYVAREIIACCKK